MSSGRRACRRERVPEALIRGKKCSALLLLRRLVDRLLGRLLVRLSHMRVECGFAPWAPDAIDPVTVESIGLLGAATGGENNGQVGCKRWLESNSLGPGADERQGRDHFTSILKPLRRDPVVLGTPVALLNAKHGATDKLAGRLCLAKIRIYSLHTEERRISR
jgi:hypothetical protein